MRHDLADESQPLRFHCVDPVIAVDEVIRAESAHPLRDACCDERLVHTAGQVGHAQPSPIRGDHQVRIERHDESAAERETVDRTHHDLRDLAESLERSRLVGLGERIPPTVGIPDGVHVTAGTERVAGAGDHEEVQRGLVGHDHGRSLDAVIAVGGQGVSLLGPIDRDGQRVAVDARAQFQGAEIDLGGQPGHEMTATTAPMS